MIDETTKHIRTASDAALVKAGGYWSQAHGDRVIAFCEDFGVLEGHSEASPKPFRVLPWQRQVIEDWYCWRTAGGSRACKVGFLTLGRKNGKTYLVALLTLYHLLADDEPCPNCITAAVDRKQASQIFRMLMWFRKNSPDLLEVLRPKESSKELFYDADNGTYTSVSSDSAGKYGHGFSFVCIDEQSMHKNDKLTHALTDADDARPNGLQIIISTAGFNVNGAFYNNYLYAKSILDPKSQVIDWQFRPHIFEPEQGANLDEEKTWLAANPSLGTVLPIETFRAKWNRAKKNPTRRQHFIRVKLNCWTATEGATWIDPEIWIKYKTKFPNLDKAPCYLAADFGATRDICAVTAIFPIESKYYVRTWGFIPQSALTVESQNQQKYQELADNGWLTIVPGNCVGIEDDLHPLLDKLIAQHTVKVFVGDKWQLLTTFQKYTKKGIQVFDFPQYHARYNEPCLMFEQALNEGKILHEGSDLLLWNIGNCILDKDTKGHCKPIKTIDSQKVDNLQTVVMAFSQAMAAQYNQQKPSIYATRGILVF